MKKQNIINNLFNGRICGLSDIGNEFKKNKSAQEISKTLRQLEKNFCDSQNESTINIFEEITNCYRKLLYINAKLDYHAGIQIGFELAETLKKQI